MLCLCTSPWFKLMVNNLQEVVSVSAGIHSNFLLIGERYSNLEEFVFAYAAGIFFEKASNSSMAFPESELPS